MIELVTVPDEIRKKYEKELFDKKVDIALANQLLKMLDYGCIIFYDENLTVEVLRKFKKAYSPATWFLNGINLFNMYYSRIETANSYLVYYASGETKFYSNNTHLKTVRIKLIETIDKKAEEKEYNNFLSTKSNFKNLSVIQKIKYNSIFKKYFGNVDKNFSLKISNKELEEIEYISIQYLHEKYKNIFFSSKAGCDEAKVNRILEDLENKKELENWEIYFLENIFFETKELK